MFFTSYICLHRMVSLEWIQFLSIKAKACIQSVNPGIEREMSVAGGLQFTFMALDLQSPAPDRWVDSGYDPACSQSHMLMRM